MLPFYINDFFIRINPIIVTKASTLVPYKEIITALFVSSVVISAVLSFVKIFDLLLPI